MQQTKLFRKHDSDNPSTCTIHASKHDVHDTCFKTRHAQFKKTNNENDITTS